MPSRKIEELKRKRQQEIKEIRSQAPLAAYVLIIILIAGGVLLVYNPKFSFLWLIGILLGVTMQRSKFCFAAGFRDPLLMGSTALLKAIIIAFIISTVGFFIVQYLAVGNPLNFDLEAVPGQIQPVGIHTILGAIMFGAGMVVAGGCASGTLMRVGEGFSMQMVSLVGFIIGTTLAAGHFEFWDKLLISSTQAIWLPQYLGFFPALLIQLTALILLYFLADWYEKKALL